MGLKKALSSRFYYYQWLFSTRNLRHGVPQYKILSIQKTIDETATILAYDLAKINYWGIDIANINIEYIWFMKKATNKIAIAGRHVNEAEKQESFDIPQEFLESYTKSTILEITA